MSIKRTSNWSSNTHFRQAPRDPLADYRGGKPNRTQRRAMARRKGKAD